MEQKEVKNRKLNRLREFNYSSSAYYFVTISIGIKYFHLSKIINYKVILNKWGKIVEKQWLWLAEQYNYIKLHGFVIMPNHMHGVIQITNEEKLCKDSLKDNVRTGRNLSICKDNFGDNVGTGRELFVCKDNPGDNVRTGRDLSLHRKVKSLSELIGAFKTTSSKIIHQNGALNFKWKRSFYDSIIWDTDHLPDVEWYITQNPDRWKDRHRS